jgi:hypothetical protein
MMTILEAIHTRHSVRAYDDRAIDEHYTNLLNNYINECNRDSGLNIQLVLNENKAFSGLLARYGKFSGVKNYIALVGKKSVKLEEKVGYFGEKIVLYAQTLGLNTCWVAVTYKKVKSALILNSDEVLCAVIAIGYGKTQGVPHVSKAIQKVCSNYVSAPPWFINGVNAALLAPTAMNQQKFTFSIKDNEVTASADNGFFTKIDLGIVKYHFEVGAGKDKFVWAE